MKLENVIQAKRKMDLACFEYDRTTSGNKICNPWNYNRAHEFEIAWRLGSDVGKVGGGDDIEGGGEIKSAEYNGLNKEGLLKQIAWIFNGRPVFHPWRSQANDVRKYFQHIKIFYPCIRLANGESILFQVRIIPELVSLAVARAKAHYQGLAKKKDQRMSIRITSSDLLGMKNLHLAQNDRESKRNQELAMEYLGGTYFLI